MAGVQGWAVGGRAWAGVLGDGCKLHAPPPWPLPFLQLAAVDASRIVGTPFFLSPDELGRDGGAMDAAGATTQDVVRALGGVWSHLTISKAALFVTARADLVARTPTSLAQHYLLRPSVTWPFLMGVR